MHSYRCLCARGRKSSERVQFPFEKRASLVRRNVPRVIGQARMTQNMKTYSFRIIAIALLIVGLAGCTGASAANSAEDTAVQTAKKNSYAARKTMRAFRSEQELKSYLKELAEKMKREPRRAVAEYGGAVLSMDTTKTTAPSKVAVAGAAQ